MSIDDWTHEGDSPQSPPSSPAPEPAAFYLADLTHEPVLTGDRAVLRPSAIIYLVGGCYGLAMAPFILGGLLATPSWLEKLVRQPSFTNLGITLVVLTLDVAMFVLVRAVWNTSTRHQRLIRKGRLLEGEVISAREFDSESGRWYSLTYRFMSPQDEVLEGTVCADEKRPCPAPGTRVHVLFESRTNHMAL